MNPLAITPAFHGEIEIPQAALLQREEVITTSKQILAVESDEDLACATEAMRGLSGLEKATEQGRQKEKRPYLDFGSLIDSFAKKFLAPVDAEIERLQPMMDGWARKQVAIKRAEEMKRHKDKMDAEAKLRDAQREIEKAKTPEKKLAAQLRAEESAMAVQSAAVVPVANTPQGLATRVSYDFEIVNPGLCVVKMPNLWTWKAGEEAWHFRRAALRVALNSETPNEYTAWLPKDGAESVVNSDYGIRVYVSVKTNVRN